VLAAEGGELVAQGAKKGTFGLLLGFIEEAQAKGFFPAGDREELARAIWAMHHGLASLAAAGAFEGAGAKGLRRIVDEAHARLLDGLIIPARN
jgi:Tetracyclin repressor-like, C-terminal domain